MALLPNLSQELSTRGAGILSRLASLKNFGLRSGNRLINSWLEILPVLERAGFEIKCFVMGYSINPSLEVELVGRRQEFTDERLKELLDASTPNAMLTSVWHAVRTTLNVYRKTDSTPQDELVVIIKVKLSPEIKVYVGQPVILS